MSIETEIKIKTSHKDLISRLDKACALKKGLLFQRDILFDSPSANLADGDKCLRLRTESDSSGNIIKSVLCYKGQRIAAKVKKRTEIETLVSDPENTKSILIEIGYKPSLTFEKERTVWLLNDCEVCLDKLALIGEYVEIEGDEDKIMQNLKILGLNPALQEKRSYAQMISEKLKDENNSKPLQAFLPKETPDYTDKTNSRGFIEIILNPDSGDGVSSSITYKLKDYFAKLSLPCRISQIGEFSDIKRYISQAKNSFNCKLIAVCGGDGTVREAIQNMQDSQIPIMILPAGTENLLAHELGCDKKIDGYIKMFEQESIQPLDIARANDKYFTSILGIGFDAEVVELFSKNREGNITHTDYIWPIWRAFWAHEIPSFKVIADGKKIFTGSGMLFAGNISRYATGLKILQDADCSDGLIDLCIFPCKSKSDIVKYLSMTMLQIHNKSDEVIYKQCRKVEVVPISKNIISQIDGDPGPKLPLDIEVIPAAVKVYSLRKVNNR